MMDDAAIAYLKDWIGRTERAEETLTGELVRRFRATLDDDPGQPETGEPAPLASHWCLAPPVAPASALGPDGHPARGGFLPPVPLPRRMWAGGGLAFHDRLRVGDGVARTSRIADVTVKSGRTGQLCFVTVEHLLSTARGLALSERHDIVYRGEGAAAFPPPDAPAAEWREALPADPTLLFRYSALTFNGHRIHYDRRYAQEVEGYADLVVHGPLQATLLLRLAAKALGAPPKRFEFRGLSPLTVGQPAFVNARRTDDGLELWVDHEGRRTMAATAGV
jgi:3-methylfumaryl-CoA hydratase